MATPLSELPDNTIVAVDTETSGLYRDSGARVAVVSYAYRDPFGYELVSRALPFDQGLVTPLGPKELGSHAGRMKPHVKCTKTCDDPCGKYDMESFDEVAPNLDPELWPEFMATLGRHRLVYHNAKFDESHLRTGLRGREFWKMGVGDSLGLAHRFAWDTQLAQSVLDPAESTALKPTSERFELLGGGERDEQTAIKPYLGPANDPRFDLIPWSVIELYAAKDAVETLLLFELQMERLAAEDSTWMPHIKKEFGLMRVLSNMEERGIGFDVETCEEEARMLHVQFERYKSILIEGGMRPTPPGARKYFFVDAGREPYPGKKTDGGQAQVDDDVVQRLIAEGVPLAEEYNVHEGIKSALAKWYDAWPLLVGHDGRLRMNHKQASTKGGRLAAERVQLHAIPHDGKMPIPDLKPVRSLFPPKPGHELWEVDVSQAEIRVGAAIAECKGFLEGFRHGIDAHDNSTILMFEIDKNSPKWFDMRQVAKRINLTIQFGGGGKVIDEQILKFTGKKYGERQCSKWKRDWLDAYPEMRTEMEFAQWQAESFGYVPIYNGRQRHFATFEMGQTYKAFNAKTQYTVAEVMARAMIKVDAEFPGTLLLQIHDSMVLEVPAGTAAQVIDRVKEIMVTEFETAMAHNWKGDTTPTIMPFKADAKRFNLR